MDAGFAHAYYDSAGGGDRNVRAPGLPTIGAGGRIAPAMAEPLPDPTLQSAPARRRKFLVVVDETPECRLALRYAALRAKNTGGRVALLYVVEPATDHQWAAVETVMRDEALEEAEHTLHGFAVEVNALSGLLPELHIREGPPKDVILDLVREDSAIRMLVLGAGTGKEGPGPLVSAFAGKLMGELPIPLTLVPGDLAPDRIDELT
jgi:nucleotide-binding universal stress UspA family protein